MLPGLLISFVQSSKSRPRGEVAAPIQSPRQQLYDELGERLRQEQAELLRSWKAHQITRDQLRHRQQEIGRKAQAAIDELNRHAIEEMKRQAPQRAQESNRQALHQILEESVGLINLLLPPGWLPLGARGLAEGNFLPALLGTLGLALIGTASLWRSYRTTLRLYRGEFTSGKASPAVVRARAKTGKRRTRLLERRLPWLSEHVSAIALAGFRSLTRANEAKILLLTPLMLVVLYGLLIVMRPVQVAEVVRPLLVFAAMELLLFTSFALVANQFGFDRGGFRVFVLCAAPRRDILLGKNLAFAPFPLVLITVLVGLFQAAYPMGWDRFLAAVPQWVSMYLLFCLLANCLSILAPMPMASGSLKPAHAKGIPFLLQLGFTFLLPLVLLPTLLPLGVELGLEALGWVKGVPVFLVLSLLECAAVVYLYRLVLTRQGRWLQAREQKILKTVASRAE